MAGTPYNPLDKKNLGLSVSKELLQRPTSPLPPPEQFNGAGVYVIYYRGGFAPYAAIAARTIGVSRTSPSVDTGSGDVAEHLEAAIRALPYQPPAQEEGK